VVVDAVQKGVDLVLSAQDPAGTSLGDVNFKETADGFEYVSLIAEEAGVYRIGVRPSLPNAPGGRYELRVRELREVSAKDRLAVQAERIRERGVRRWRQGGADSMEEALSLLGEARQLYREAGVPGAEGRMLGDIGIIHWQLGRPAEALAYYDQSLLIRRATGDRHGEAMILSNMGLAYTATGRPRQALDAFQSALALWRRQGIRSGEGLTLHQLGYAQMRLGEYQAALETLRRGVAVSHAAQERANEAAALATLGTLYTHLGEEDTAFRHLAQARALFSALGDRRGEARTLLYLVKAYRRKGQLAEAVAAGEKSARLYRAMGDPTWEASARIQLGATEMDGGRSARASKELQTALDLARQTRDLNVEAPALAELGRLRLRSGEPGRAAELFAQALPLLQATGNRAGEADVHHMTADLLREAGDLEGALRESAAAVAIVESLRADVAAPELRATYFSGAHDPFDLHVDVLMRLHDRDQRAGHAAAGLETVERGRARSLVELLAEGRLDLRGAVDPATRQREQDLHARISWLQGRVVDLRLKGADPEAEAAALEKELEAAEGDRQRLEEEIRRTSPRYAEIRYPRPLDLAGIQALLDADTALVEYALGEPSYVFVVTRAGLEARRIASEQAIREQVQRLRPALRRPGRLGRTTYLDAAHRLYRMVMSPAVPALQGKRKLLIAPDGPLDYVPFEALLTRPAPPTVADDGLPYLLRRWTVAYLPSATTLAGLRERRRSRAADQGGKALAVFADPVLPAAAGRHPQPAGSPGEDALRGILDDVGLTGLRPLPHSRREAEGLAGLFPPGDVALYLDAAATEENLKTSGDVGSARALHFATHALVSARRPARSALVLSRSPGSKEDGLLQAYELGGLNLRADLVVLSACETGLGRELKGEGIVGLTRAFLHAGAASVAASLWQVADRSTADLMLAFYRHRGQSSQKSEALRLAKLELIAGKRFAHPFYWAPFVLSGEP
jgi:CHAT domain-containing protein/tetratricopeptide (TPR) repeat protein